MPKLPRTVWLLGIISLLNDSASELVYPLLPLYLTGVLMAGPRTLGAIEGVAEALSGVMKLVAGALSDRFGSRKAPVVWGYSLAALSRPLYALAVSAWGVFALRALDRLGKALRSAPRDALLAASVPEAQRGVAFGIHRSMDHAGAVIGPLLAFVLLAEHVPIRWILIGSAVPGVLCVAASLAVRELAVREPAVVLPAPPAAASTLPWRRLQPRYRRYLVALGLFTLGNSSNMFLLLKGKAIGLDDAQIALSWAVMSGVAMALGTPLSSLSDRVGRHSLIAGGWALYGALYALLAFMESKPAFFALIAALGVVMAATEGAEKALVADLAEEGRRGGAFGWFYLVSGGLLLPASLLCGELWARSGPRLAFAASACFAWVAAGTLWLYVREPRASRTG